MKCSHLVKHRNVAACSALQTPYVPSQFELEEYCRANEHRKCPFYLKGIICIGRSDDSTWQVVR